MKVSFPAMKGIIGKKQYFATMMALSEIPHLFKFNDWQQFTPELRAQRVLVKSRVPEIVKYIVDNEDSYLFSSITAAYDTVVKFNPVEDGADIGYLQMDLEDAKFLINDGQHRCAAITAALTENPAIGKEKISVLLFPWESLERAQQMFTDLNRFVQKTSKSLNILYDHRDALSGFTMEVTERVPVFRGMVDKEKLTIPIRSEKLFTLSTLYDANEELIGTKLEKPDTPEYKEKLERAVSYWNAVTRVIPDWQKVKDGTIKATMLRQEKINTHGVMLRALGGLGKAVLEAYPDSWEKKLEVLSELDWRKSVGNKVNPEWENVCITAGSVLSNRQARVATLSVLKHKVGLDLSNQETQFKIKRDAVGVS
ncbi:MAG: DNA sulfur modification protein DndB [Terriglobales bacterium]